MMHLKNPRPKSLSSTMKFFSHFYNPKGHRICQYMHGTCLSILTMSFFTICRIAVAIRYRELTDVMRVSVGVNCVLTLIFFSRKKAALYRAVRFLERIAMEMENSPVFGTTSLKHKTEINQITKVAAGFYFSAYGNLLLTIFLPLAIGEPVFPEVVPIDDTYYYPVYLAHTWISITGAGSIVNLPCCMAVLTLGLTAAFSRIAHAVEHLTEDEQLQRVVRMHQDVLSTFVEVRDILESILAVTVFVYIVSSLTVTVCVLLGIWDGFLLAMEIYSVTSASSLFLMGDVLSKSISRVGVAAYNSVWYTRNAQWRRSTGLMMTISQKNIALNLILGRLTKTVLLDLLRQWFRLFQFLKNVVITNQAFP